MTPTTPTTVNRFSSIDLLRGIVMVIMALDHVRDYFHADAFLYDPTDLSQTTVALFFTRWITHFCAPVFVFLAGTSAYLIGMRKGKKELSVFLLKRGLWLIFLELTVVNFAWFFNIHFTLMLLVVIWALGAGMIMLAAIIHLPKQAILFLGLLLVGGHNLLDNIQVDGSGWQAIGWAILHQFQFFPFDGWSLFVGYPIIAWTGIMALGYCFGELYTLEASLRKRYMLQLGGIAVLLFILIRTINVYGDPVPWSAQDSVVYSALSFINVSKYPPSLLYILVTLGPAILFLAFAERPNGKLAHAFVTFGRVPMFYYLLHLYLIHGLAVLAAIATGYGIDAMINFETWVTLSENLKGYGFNLWMVYGVWVLVVLALYPLCKWYDRYKSNHREKWWLSYL